MEEWLEELVILKTQSFELQLISNIRAKLCHYLPEDVMKKLCEKVKEHLMEGKFLRNVLQD